VPGKPQEGVLRAGHLDTIYGRSAGGLTPSGWGCTHLPYLEADLVTRAEEVEVAVLPSRTPRNALEGQLDQPILEQLETLATLHPIVRRRWLAELGRALIDHPQFHRRVPRLKQDRPLLLRPIEDMFEI